MIRRSEGRLYFKNIFQKYDLIIYDDCFPWPITGFRIAEFSYLLKKINKSKIILNPICYPYLNLSVDDFKIDLRNFKLQNKNIKNKLKNIFPINNINTKLFYSVFLFNIYTYLNLLEKLHIDFAFTLYPGGGFKFDDDHVDWMLKKLVQSEHFKGVIVNQKCIEEYLISKIECPSDKIHYIFGVPVLNHNHIISINERSYFGKDKKTLDIVFVAVKYTAHGEDKGFDLFMKTVELFQDYDNINFHVVGGFSRTDITAEINPNKIHFYGLIPNTQLRKFLEQFDIILSPNRPGKLGNGSFDGFLLTTCVEASMAGCLVMATDELEQNDSYIDQEEFIRIKPDMDSITSNIQNLYENPARIHKIAINGFKKTNTIYSTENQLEKRIEILKSLM